jgi:hypothetical protein
MSNLSDYNEKIEASTAIPDEKAKIPQIPVYTYIQEAEAMHYQAKKDQEQLTRVGLPAEIIEEIPKRAGACREAQSRWNEVKNKRKKARKNQEKEKR